MKTQLLVTVEHPADLSPWDLIQLAVVNDFTSINGILAEGWSLSYCQTHNERAIKFIDDTLSDMEDMSTDDILELSAEEMVALVGNLETALETVKKMIKEKE